MGHRLLSALVILCLASVQGQENAQTRLSAGLTECYQDANLFDRENRLPVTMNMLIEIIRKAEDSPEVRNDINLMTTSLIHRFRQDGIERAPGVFNSATILPFSPSGHQFTKHRILLTRLLPGNAQSFPNATLTAQERCALHFMLSSSIDTQIRNDEATRCNQLAQYRTRIPRDAPKYKSNYVGDVEFLHDMPMSKLKKHLGRMQLEGAEGEEELAEEPLEEAPAEEDEGEIPDDENEDPSIDPRNEDAGIIDIASNQVSQCPLENGIVSTRWGAITGGTLIAGIAAGLRQESVMVRDLVALSRHGEYKSGRQASPQVDNRWAATLAGDLAEVALLQGPTQINLGAPGTFNSTTMPRWHFLNQRERFEMTDAEIRGGIDGLVLATNIMTWRNRVPAIRLSQVLDMYYSQRGVFTRDIRACNRNALFTGVAPLATMVQQTAAFTTVLERDMQMRVTLAAQTMAQFSEAAAQALSAYVPASISNLPCGATSIIPNEDSIFRAAVDLFIYVDMSWPFREVQPAVAHLLDNLDVSRFGTTYSLMNSMDGTVIVPRTESLADLYSFWNASVHAEHPNGFSLRNVLEGVNVHTTILMESERQNNSIALKSKIALIVPNAGGVTDNDANHADQLLRTMRENMPDLRILFLTGGQVNRFERFVQNARRDIFPLRPNAANDNGIPVQVNEVVIRVLQIPRRIINPRCGPNWQADGVGNHQQNDYVEPGGVIFYRIPANYYFGRLDNGNRRVRIQGHGYSTITVCSSREVENPRSNTTNVADIRCQRILGDSFDVNLNNLCDHTNYIHRCDPVFISVEGSAIEASAPLRCTENDCRFPDSARYGVHIENLGCFNAGGKLFVSILSLLLPLAVVIKRIFH